MTAKRCTELSVGDKVWIDDGNGAWGTVESVTHYPAANGSSGLPFVCCEVRIADLGSIPRGWLHDGVWTIQGNARRSVSIHA